MSQPETINHPLHYNSSPAKCDACGHTIECIQVVRHMNFNLGNVVKYLWRAGQKDAATELEDLKKAKWYLDDEIKRLEAQKTTSEAVVESPLLTPESPRPSGYVHIPLWERNKNKEAQIES